MEHGRAKWAACIDHIKLIAATELDVGMNTKEHLCPWCDGGQSRERAFSLTRTEVGLLYKCHRASCGKSGFIPTIASSLPTTPQREERRKTRPYTGEYLPLNGTEIQFFYDEYGLEYKEICDFSYDPRTGRIVQPWHTVLGHLGGHILRGYHGQKPKSLTYWNNDGVPMVDYYIKFPWDRSIWLVEDQLSAIKLSRFENSAALLGAYISPEVAEDIRKNFHTVYLALDNDATIKAIEQTLTYNLYFRNFRVVVLSKDVKNMNNDEIQKLIGDHVGSKNLRSPATREARI
jgi:hypothetical protein